MPNVSVYIQGGGNARLVECPRTHILQDEPVAFVTRCMLIDPKAFYGRIQTNSKLMRSRYEGGYTETWGFGTDLLTYTGPEHVLRPTVEAMGLPWAWA